MLNSNYDLSARAEYEAEAIIRRVYKAIGADVGEAIVLDEDAKSVIHESLIRWTARAKRTVPDPKTAAERADLLMSWYEGHTVPSLALRDEIVVQLRAYAHQHVEAWQKRAAAGSPRDA